MPLSAAARCPNVIVVVKRMEPTGLSSANNETRSLSDTFHLT